MRKRCYWLRNFGTVRVCPPADSPHNPFHSKYAHRPTLSAPPTGGALVLGGICVTNFTLFPCPLAASLSLFSVSQTDVWTKTWCQSVGETMGLLPLATWIPTQWWPREYPVSNGINGGIEGEGDREWEEERESLCLTHQRDCVNWSPPLSAVWDSSTDDKDGLLLDLCVCVCGLKSVYIWPNWPKVMVLCS